MHSIRKFSKVGECMDSHLSKVADIWGFQSVKLMKDIEVKGGRVVQLLTTERGDFVFKSFDVSTDKEHIEKFTLALDYLGNREVKLSPKLLKTKNQGLYTQIDGRYAYIMEYIEGRQLSETPEDEYLLGQASALLHSLVDYEADSILDTNECTKNMRDRFSDYSFKEEYDKVVASLPDFNNYRKAFIHTDIGPHNAMMDKDGRIIFIDLDDAGRGSIFIDAGYPLITQFVRYQENGELKFNAVGAEAFYKGYFSGIKLTKDEKELLFYGAVFMQLIYMPVFGEEGIVPMWGILKFAIDHKEELMAVLMQ